MFRTTGNIPILASGFIDLAPLELDGPRVLATRQPTASSSHHHAITGASSTLTLPLPSLPLGLAKPSDSNPLLKVTNSSPSHHPLCEISVFNHNMRQVHQSALPPPSSWVEKKWVATPVSSRQYCSSFCYRLSFNRMRYSRPYK